MKFWKKKDKGPYPKTFAKRLGWSILVRTLLIMIVPILLLFASGYTVTLAGVALLSERMVKGEYEVIRRITSELHVAVTNTMPEIKEKLDKPEKMHAIMERLLKLNPGIRSCGISFRDSYYPEKGRWYCPYVVRGDSTDTQTLTLGDSGYDYLHADWFVEAMKREEAYWGTAWVDTTDNDNPMVSYLTPIRDNRDSIVGILGVDLSLKWLAEQIQFESAKLKPAEKWNAKNQYYYVMVDSTGTLLVHPDMGRAVKKKFQNYITVDPDSAIKDILALEEGDAEEISIDGTEVYITFNPIKHTNWSLAMIFPNVIIDVFGYLLGGFFIVVILIGLLAVWFFGRRVIRKTTRPLQQLAAAADEVAKGNFDAALPEVHTKDEIQQLRDSFENMQQSLILYTDELRMTTAAKVSMESELKIAHDIQMSMLPKTFPPYPDRNDVDIYGSLTPAKGVGGDLFDFFIRDEKLFFCIGDVSGKGVPASLYMAVTRSLFRNVSGHINEPDRIVEALNKAQNEGNDTNMFVTIFVGVLDLQTGVLNYCNGGHDAPLLVGRDVGELPCDPNLPIGVIGDFKFSQQQVNIDTNTTIFLFTDGLNEAENAAHQQFGDQRIWNVARRLLSENSHQPEHMIEEMTNAVHQFVGDAEQSDDLTMLAIQYKK